MGIFNENIPEVTWLDNASLIVLVLAAFNWPLYAFLDINLVTYFIANPYVHYMLYIIIGLAAIKVLFFWKKCLACSHV